MADARERAEQATPPERVAAEDRILKALRLVGVDMEVHPFDWRDLHPQDLARVVLAALLDGPDAPCVLVEHANDLVWQAIEVATKNVREQMTADLQPLLDLLRWLEDKPDVFDDGPANDGTNPYASVPWPDLVQLEAMVEAAVAALPAGLREATGG